MGQSKGYMDVPLTPSQLQSAVPVDFGTRADGSPKGNGFLGAQPRTDGGVSSEISIGVNIDGKDLEIPTMVPTLAPSERQWLLSNDVSDPSKIPVSIINKATNFAKARLAAGQSPFAGAEESPKPKPAYEDVPIKGPRTWTDTAVDALPMVGGALGGLAAAPGIVTSFGGAAFGGAAGEAAKQLINRARGVEAPATATDAAKDMGISAAINAAGEGAGKAIGAGLLAGAPWLMQKALKPAKSVLNEFSTTGPKIVQTLLNEGVNVTEGGLAKLHDLLSMTNKEIKALVANAPGTVDKKIIAARALPVASRVSKQANPVKDLAAVGESVGEFLDHPVYKGDMSIPDLQAMKQVTYKQIGGKYGELSSAQVETQKALARGAKEEVANAVPGVSALNKRDSDLMAATEAVGRQVATAGNKDPVGFAWVAHDPKTFLAALFDRSPAIKSMVAHGMWKSAGAAAKVSPQIIRAAVLSLMPPADAPPQE